MEQPADLLSKAFHLAYFIHRDRRLALTIACEAMAATEVAVTAQDKRRYYVPAGRKAGGWRQKSRRDKVSMDRAQLLQRLVYSESETFEKTQEKAESGVLLSDGDMTVRFIEHLVRITLRRNAFHVTLGLGRLLYRYSTEETANLYDAVVQDPDRFRDHSYFRSRKKQLLEELCQRFGTAIRVCRGPRGEKVVESRKDPGSLAELVTAALRMFTPWHTRCVVPEGFNPMAQELADLRFRGSNPDREHPIELRRMHAVLHPPCFAKLTRALGLKAPERRLAVPVFHREPERGSGQGPRGDRFDPPELCPGERQEVEEELGARAGRRRRAKIGYLSISVDGRELRRIDLARETCARLRVTPDAERLDVHSCDGREEVLLATYLFSNTARSVGKLPSMSSSMVLEAGQEISFEIDLRYAGEELLESSVEVRYRETRPLRAISLLWRRFGHRSQEVIAHLRGAQAVPTLARMLSVLGIIAVAGFLYLRIQVQGPPVRAPVEDAGPAGASVPEAPGSVVADQALRGGHTREAPTKLSEVAKIYVDFLGSGPFQERLRQALIEQLSASENFRLPDLRADADAVIKSTELENGAGIGTNREDAPVTLQLVNKQGVVLWRGSDQGTVTEVARRMVLALTSQAEVESSR